MSAHAPLRGCVALVTGGSSGIGAATVAALLDRGAHVVSAARRPAPLDHPRVSSVDTDLLEPASAARAVDQVLSAHGRLDVLVCAAGVMLLDQVSDMPAEHMERMVAVNLTGTMLVVRAALQSLAEAASGARGCADVVLIGSASARRPTPMRAVYAATKAGLAAFADCLRQEQLGTRVRTTLVEPGLTTTALRAANSPETIQAMLELTPTVSGLQALEAEDVAAAIAWSVTQPPHVSIGELSIAPSMLVR